MKLSEPIIVKTKLGKEELEKFEKRLSKLTKKQQKLIKEYPIVYIYVWKERKKYNVYVGETKELFRRITEHNNNIRKPEVWENKLKDKDVEVYAIAYEHFNKSMTGAVENQLIKYLSCIKEINRVYNEKGNEQKSYYTDEEFNTVFSKIWRKLGKENDKLFLSENYIKKSAVFKASPLQELCDEQQKAKEKIIKIVDKAIKNNARGQLVFVEGEAGVGKSVLSSSTFYEIFCKYEREKKQNKEAKSPSCFLIINHGEQITLYKEINKRLGLTYEYGELVYKATTFIKNNSVHEPVDIVFIDEGHLLLTQGQQVYTGKNQLKDILDRARVVVVLFDKNQILQASQYLEDQQIEKYRKEAIKNKNYIKLTEQHRIKGSKEAIDWLDSFTKKGIVNKIPHDLGQYEIKVFKTIQQLEEAIKDKASNKKTKLSRIIATYDWKYNPKKSSKSGKCKYYEVKIGEWHKPWNYEIKQYMNKEEIKKIKNLSWAEQTHTIEEVGSTYTILGFDLNYAGVILGPSIKYEDGKIVFNPDASCNSRAIRKRALSNGTLTSFASKLLRNELRVLMTRGVNGVYIYACDDKLREKLEKCANDVMVKV